MQEIIIFEDRLKKEKAYGRLTDKTKVLRRAVILFNRKDFGVSNILQLPDNHKCLL